MHTRHPRPGFALLIALIAIALVTALLLGTALRTDQDARVARAETVQQRAFASADAALWQTLRSTNPALLRTEPIGTVIASEESTGGVTTHVWITRVDTTLVWLTTDAQVQRGAATAHHRLGLSAILPADPIKTRLYPTPGRAWVDLY
ncbi:MAG TPA: hypothetical protein VNU46_07130 [Gemmatimonadaceae bacterium]|jgi:Tfp pilus assembly protein PilX|nr:hypothetical protein [Gemmatimonadaceae bacterium]